MFHQPFSLLQGEEAKSSPVPGDSQRKEGSRRADLEASVSAVVVRALYDFLCPLVMYIFRVPVLL